MDSHDSLYNKPIVFRAKDVTVDNVTPMRQDVGYRNEFEYINSLPITVRVATRQGVTFSIRPDNKLRGREFRIRQTQRWDWRVDIDADGITQSRAAEAKAMVDSLFANLTGHPASSGKSATVSTVLTRADFENNGGTLYIENLDIVLSIKGEGVLVHPYSEQGRQMELIRDTQGAGLNDAANFTIRIVDNHRRLGAQFINLNGDVYRVPACEDHNMEDGIYVIRTGISQGDYAPSPPTVERYDFEEGREALRLFDNVQAAKVHGNVEAATKHQYDLAMQESKNEELKLKSDLRDKDRQLKEVEFSLKQLVAQTEGEKQDFELTKLRMEDEIRRQKHEIGLLSHRLEMANMQRKDYYDDRGAQRKDSSEMLKWLPLVIAGIGAAILGFRK